MGLRLTLIVDGSPRPVSGTRVTGNLFETLGVVPFYGRALTQADEGAGRPGAVVLSYHLWREAFGSDPNVVGRMVELGEASYRVVGVMPEDFPPLWREDQFWLPFPFSPQDVPGDQNFLSVIGRLRAGMTPAGAQSYMENLIRRLEAVRPEGNEGRHAHVETRTEAVTGHVQEQLLLLMGAVALLLLIACGNLAGLALVRGFGRRREMALRAALGAERGRIVLGLFLESLVMAALGAALALPLAQGIVTLVVALGPTDLPRRGEIALDPAAVAFALTAAVLSAILFGLGPGLRSVRANLTEALKEGGAGSAGGVGNAGGASRMHQSLVVAQVGLACVLLCGAGLLGGSLLRLQAVDKGFDEEGVLSFRIQPPRGAYEGPEELHAFYEQLLQHLRAVPGVSTVGATWALPFGETFGSSSYRVEGRPDDEEYLVQLVPVLGDYFKAMGIPVIEGRSFREGDGVEGPLVTVISQATARRIWPGEDPIGRRLRKGTGEEAVFVEVVGVVPDVAMLALGEDPLLQTFWPQEAVPWAREMYFTLKTPAVPLSLVPSVRQAVGRVDPRVPLAEVSTMGSRVARQLAGPRFRTLLVGAFALVAGLLAVMGLYGTTASIVAHRTREIGIRVALGAQKATVMQAVLGRSLLLATVGLVPGLLGGVALSRIAGALLFHVGPLEPLVLSAVAAIVLLASMAAAWAPARRASSVDPVRALRVE